MFEDGDEPGLCRKAWDPGGGLGLIRKRTFLGERTGGGREGGRESEREKDIDFLAILPKHEITLTLSYLCRGI